MDGLNPARADAIDEAVIAATTALEAEPRPEAAFSSSPTSWKARLEIERHRAETERLRVLVDFLTRPIHAHGGSDPDPDIVTAYNLAIEAVLNGIRKAATGPLRPSID